MAAKRRTAKDALRQITLRAYMAIYAMTPAQRRQALRALSGLTETNCGWYLYAARPLLAEFIGMATPLPKRARKRDEGGGK